MKYLILITVLLTTSVSAQEVPPFYSVQHCDTFKIVSQEVESFGETILFNGEVTQLMAGPDGTFMKSQFVFTTNQDTGTWSLISLFPNMWACTIASGDNFKPYIK